MPEAVIVATARTPIGRAFKGTLVNERSDDMAGFIIDDLLKKVPAVDRSTIDDVIVGVANMLGPQGFNLARQAGLIAGIPDTVAATTVTRFCASSTQAIRMAFHAIKAGEGDTYVAGGVESISQSLGGGGSSGDTRNPRFVEKDRPDYINDAYIAMGLTAENVARQWGISRERQDEFALLSQNRAEKAQANGFFEREITPLPLSAGGTFDKDECPRAGTTLEGLAKLKPAFLEDGTVTAGNACPLNDGAAAVLVMSDERAKALGLTPIARILGSAVSGVAPEIMGVGPIEACRKLFAQTGLTIKDVDVVELNEAFAAQVLPVCDEVGIDIEGQLNPHGGAIALGHPFGMTGARIMTTLLNDLQTLDKSIGLETMCVGGGQGMAILVERLS
jgi:acetyl-CoA C-acetyltransferase